MTLEENQLLHRTISDLRGQILALLAILIANPTLKLDQQRIGKLIEEIPLDVDKEVHGDIRARAKAMVTQILDAQGSCHQHATR